MMRSLKAGIFSLGHRSGFFAGKRWLSKSDLRIVTYHGVDTQSHPVVNFDHLQTHPELFTRQLEALARAFQPIDLAQAVRYFISEGRWPERAVAVTFDDGYRNNLEVAAPILQRLGIPATFFVTAGFVEGRTSPWWYDVRTSFARKNRSGHEARLELARLEATLRPMSEHDRHAELEKLGVERGAAPFYPFMNAGECRQLIGMGFDVQCHGVTHASFSAEPPEVVEREIRESAAFVRELGCAPWALAYPYGHEPAQTEAARAVMRECGLIAAFTTREGANGRDANPWRLRRWDMHGGYTAAAALARVS